MTPSSTVTRLLQYGVLFLVALLLIVTATYLCHQRVIEHRYQIQKETEQQLYHYYSALYADIHSHIQLAKGLPGLFSVNPDLPEAQFARAVEKLLTRDSEIRNIAVAPDMIVRYVYPFEDNEKAIGLDFRKNAAQFETADRARRTREVVLAGPVNLVQGGVGLIMRVPVFLSDEQDEESFWGLISVVIDIERFLTKNGLQDPDALPLKFAMRGKDALGRLGEVFYGDPALFEAPRLMQTLKLPEGEWVLVGEPLEGWNSLPQNIGSIRLSYYGIAVLIFLLIAALLRSSFATALANHKFRNLVESSPVPYMLLGHNGQILFVNKAFTDSYRYNKDDLNELKSWWEITDKPTLYQKKFKEIITVDAKGHVTGQNSEQSPMEINIECPDNKQRVALISVSSLSDTLDKSVLVVVYDITERKLAEDQLRFSSRVFNQAQEGIMITTITGMITDVNPAFCEITGYSREEVIGRQPSMLKSGKHSLEFYRQLWESVLDHGYWQGEVWNRRKSGELYAELLTISAMTDDDGERRHFVGLFSDITQSKKQQETLELMAHYDVLTKLPNRVLFADRFTQAVGHSHRTNTLLAVCFLDLDGFKPVNDSCGHEIGDQLLVEVASRLKQSVREEDTISRFGGDEFAILIRDIHSEMECEQLLKRIHQALASPYQINGNVIQISASSGVTFYPTDNADLDTLLRHADQSMYEAKLLGRNTYHLFNPALNQQSEKRQQWLDEVRLGLERDEFRLFYQPKVNMRSGRVIGMEALIRWAHPEQGLLAPAKFLPVTEGTSLEIEIGRWVIAEALKQLSMLHQNGYQIEVSVNISSNHLLSKNFIGEIAELLELYPAIQSSYLQLEILETSALGDIAAVSKLIKSVRDKLGVSVALDDFGTGYSSLTHLRHLAVSTIKIDQGFVRDMLDDPQDFTIVDGVIGLAESYGRNVIAEGVETLEHGTMLLMIGCEWAQGYGIARPMPATEVLDWLTDYRPNKEWIRVAKESWSEKDHALKIFELTSQRWLKNFHDSVMSEPEQAHHWPILSHKKCHSGRWIKRERTRDLFGAEWIDKFQALHFELHQIASQIHEIYLSEGAEKAREKLAEMKVIETALENLLRQEKN